MKRFIGASTAAAVVVAAVVAISSPVTAASATSPIVSVGDGALAEGHAASRVLNIPVVLDVPASTVQTVNYTVTGSTATAGAASQSSTVADFKNAAGVLQFNAGTVVQTIKVMVYGDTRVESDETVAITLTSVSSGLVVGDDSGTATIVDDEATPGAVASIGSLRVTEGDSKVRKLSIPVVLSQASPGAVVKFRVVAGTTTGGWSGTGVPPVGVDASDKSTALQTLTFTTAAVEKYAVVVVNPDLDDEADETFTIVIESVTGAAVGANGTGTIADDDYALVGDVAFGASPTPIGSVVPGSTLVGCAQASQRITVTVSMHLDPNCVYTRGFTIGVSNVTLDCRGASVTRGITNNDPSGILITAPTTTALTNVTVRNCDVAGFGNNLRVTRVGFKNLVFGSEYLNSYSNILIENNTFDPSKNSGVFIDGFVTGVTFSHNTVRNAGSVGVYLEAGSKDNVIEYSDISNNGYGDVIPGPASFVLGATTIYFLSTGREGIAVDGSRNNVIHDNLVSGNSAGGIFLYKNCGEDASTGGHWVRNYGADNNVVRRNVITNGPNGVWIGSRAAENQHFMDCSDTPIVDNPASLQRIYLDPANQNVVEYNRIDGMVNAIRIEADNATVRGNSIANAARGVMLGTKTRTEVLAQPITGAAITGNLTQSVTTPFSWVWGKGTTTFSGNVSGQSAGRLVAGSAPTINPFLFVIGFVPGP